MSVAGREVALFRVDFLKKNDILLYNIIVYS